MYELIDRVTQPQYTGANRCLPCTVLNLILALAGATAVSLWSPVVGLGFLGSAIVIIYLRGYLVPGTPTFTRRYLPDVVLEWFGKGLPRSTVDEPVSIDPEDVLREADAVTPCRDDTDLCLAPEFRTTWQKRTRPSDDEMDSEAISKALGEPRGEVDVEEAGDGLVTVKEGTVIHQWPSTSALAADLSAAGILEERLSDWDGLTATERGRVLASLRVFREQCPDCGGLVRLDREVVESCCGSRDVLRAACRECNEPMLELEWRDELRAREREAPAGTTP